MPLFRQRITPGDMGTILYDTVHRAFLEGPMSYEAFAEQLGKDSDDLPEEYPGEVLIGLLYGAVVAIEASYEESVGGRILEALVNVYVSHGAEGGLSRNKVEQLKSQFLGRIHEYTSCLRNTAGMGPAWHLGKAFYKNVVGEARESAIGVAVATRYFFASIDGAKGALKQYKVVG